MPRWAFCLFALLAASAPALAQGKDRVYFRDRTADKVTDLEGDVTETAAGIKVTSGLDKKERFIPGFDLVRVDYAAVDPVIRQAAGPLENDKDPTKPAAYYADKLKALPATANEKTKRFLAFRDAYWAGRIADAKTTPDEFAAEATKATDKIAAFIKGHKKTWEQFPLGRMAARLFAEAGDFKSADAVLKELAAVPDAPPEVKAEAKVLRLGYLLRAGNYPEAKTVAAEAEAEATGSAKERAAMYKEAVAVLPAKDSDEADPNDPGGKKKVRPTAAAGKIEGLIGKAKDPLVRSTGYGVLGELYLAHGLPRDAMWSFLWVDTVYSQDRDELVRSLHRLAAIFDTTGDKDGEKSRGDQFREKLPRVR